MTTVNGTLATMSVPDLLQWLLTGGKTGVLTVVNGGVKKRLYLSQGTIVGATSSDPDLAFGQFLLDLAKIDEATLMNLVRKQRETGVMMGKLLTTDGIMSEEEVLDVLHLKARETVFELMAWREGDFEFVDGQVTDSDRVKLSIPIDSVIFEGIRRAEQRRKMREAFPSGNMIPALWSDEGREAMLNDEAAAPMVSLMDRGASLRDLARSLRLSVIEVCRRLYPYLSQGMLVVGISSDPEIPAYYLPEVSLTPAPDSPAGASASTGGPAGHVPDPNHMRELAERFLENAEFEEAVATIERAQAIDPNTPAIRDLAQLIEERYVSALWTYFEGGDAVPVMAVGIRELPNVKPLMTSEEVFVASRITGGSTVKEIISMSPLSEFRTLRILRIFADSELVILRGAHGSIL